MKYNDINEAINSMLDSAKAFHDRYFRAYGQIILRLDDESYIMSNDNLKLSSLKPMDFKICDINSGDVGMIFRNRPDINAIVVMCTEASVWFSAKGAAMKPALVDLAQLIGPDVQIAPDGKATSILRAIKQRGGCFVKNAGIIAVGPDMDTAIASALIIEKSAEAEVYADKLGGLKHLTTDEVNRLVSFGKSYAVVNNEAYVDYIAHSDEEFAMRGQIIDCGIALCDADLIQGTRGNISMRLDENHILISPSGMKYHRIKPEDIVKLSLDDMSYDQQRTPSSEYKLHAGIYKKYPECNAVIHTHSNGCGAFAAARAGFRTASPELKDIIGDLHVSDYAHPGTDELTESVMNALEGTHACIISNHGALFYSHSLDLALAIANAVEDKACNLIGLGNPITIIEDEHEEEQ